MPEAIPEAIPEVVVPKTLRDLAQAVQPRRRDYDSLVRRALP